MLQKKIQQYIADWKKKGYSDDIPDDAPVELTNRNLAPCYRMIVLALLKNDVSILGYAPPKSEWYGYFKRIELAERKKKDV